MTEKDIIFKDLTKEELSTKPQNEISHFGWEGNGAFAFSCNADAYFESAETLYAKMRESGKKFSVLDGHIYPLVFLYRHFVELYLKGLYIKYSGESEENIKIFLNEVGHDLNASWAKIKPFLSKGKKHVGSSQNIGAIEHYIKEINKFDSTSMTMRYPITKDLDTMHPKAIHLDYINLHDRMAELFDALHQLDYDVDNQMSDIATEEEIADFINHFNALKPILNQYISALDNEIQRDMAEEESDKPAFERLMTAIRDNRDKALRRQKGEVVADDYHGIYENSGDDFKILVESLYYSGRHVRERQINLAKNPEERHKEFVSCCIKHLKYEGMKFGKEVRVCQTNVFSKSASAIKKNISLAISLLSETGEKKD